MFLIANEREKSKLSCWERYLVLNSELSSKEYKVNFDLFFSLKHTKRAVISFQRFVFVVRVGRARLREAFKEEASALIPESAMPTNLKIKRSRCLI